MQTTTSRRALIGFAMVFATLLAIALISYLNVRQMHENARQVGHSHEVLLAVYGVFTRVVAVEIGQRSYVATGDPSSLERYENAVARVTVRLNEVEKLTSDNPRQQQNLAELRQQVDRKLRSVEAIIAARRDQGYDAARELILTGEGRLAMEDLRQIVARMDNEERRLLADRQAQSETSYWIAIVSGLLAAAIGLGLAVAAYVLVGRDMDTRAKAAAELQAANESLEQRTAELARLNQTLHAEIAERKRAEEALREADQRKDQFLATLAHELRNPLSPLASAAQLIGLEPDNTAQIRELAAVLSRQVAQLKRLIDDLIDVSRISRGKLQLHREPVSLEEVITAALDVGRPLIEASAHALRVSLPPEPLVIHGDKVRLSQVVGNLLINAAKYTPPQGQIELDVRAENGQAVIRVCDNGIGIAPEMQTKVFGLFTQVDTSSTRSQGGLGIGLTLAKTLVEMHGGSIHAASPGPRQGSEFTVRLPLPDPQTVAVRKTLPSPELGPVAPIIRVLVVDDNESASHLLSRLLEKLGHQARVVHSAAAALELVRQFAPNVIISDIAMPGISGYELATKIRELRLDHRPVLVALTGYGQESDRQAALVAGFDEHLTKPIGLTALQSLLESLTDHPTVDFSAAPTHGGQSS